MISTDPMGDKQNVGRRHRRQGIFFVRAALVVSTLLSMPSDARAASYSVWACADGAGRPLTRGEWNEVRINGPGHLLSSTCGDPAAIPITRLSAVAESVRGHSSTDSGAGWKVQAPPGTKITGLDVWWSGTIPAGPPTFAQYTGSVEILAPGSIFRVAGNNFTGAFFGPGAAGGKALEDGNHWNFHGLSTSDVTLMAWCLSKCDGVPGVDGEVLTKSVSILEAYRLKTVVEDAIPPGGSAAGLDDGTRISVPTVLSATATDVGSGVREISLRVDGRVVQRASPAGSCADVDPRNSDPLEYTSMQPCPGQHAAAFTLSPGDLGDGARHVVSVVATDAAGQETSIMAARAALVAPAGYFASWGFFNPDLDVVRPRRPNGVNAGPAKMRLSFAVVHGTHARSVNRRVVGPGVTPRITGRLTTAAGTPISGGRVWRASAVAGGDWEISGAPLTTSAVGRVSGRLPAHRPTRDVRLVYFPYSDSSENVQSPVRRLGVRAATTMGLDKARYRNGDTVNFSGRITTGPVIPRKSVYLQVVVRGRWRTFDTTRADLAGRWTVRYRFTATRRLTAYRFRAVIPAEQSFPWATGRSQAVRVLVRP
jgi:hypothetical protein